MRFGRSALTRSFSSVCTGPDRGLILRIAPAGSLQKRRRKEEKIMSRKMFKGMVLFVALTVSVMSMKWLWKRPAMQKR